MLLRRGTRCVLGLRDVMDDPTNLVDEWERKGVYPALDRLFDEIWVYGRPELFDPVREIPGMAPFAGKTRFTGYLRRTMPDELLGMPDRDLHDRDYILVMTGGGGDGQQLIDWVISAYEHDSTIPWPALLVLGPFMHPEVRGGFLARVERLPKLRALTFEAQVERLYERAIGVVAMGGYNTFCEILSFGKPALIVPRTRPRLEQRLRAERAEGMGLAKWLDSDGDCDPARMADAIRELPHLPLPEVWRYPGLLDGLEGVADLVEPWLADTGSTARQAPSQPRTLRVAASRAGRL